MPEVRMSLAEASACLRIAPNTVRSRWKAGKVRGERDNAGKIWVWVDPDLEGSKKQLSKPSIEGSIAPQLDALRDHIQTLTDQLVAANAELATLRPYASEAARLEATAAGLRDHIDALKDDRDAWRQTAESLLVSRQEPKRYGGFLGLFRR